MDTNDFENFLRCRKLMLNWIRIDKKNKTLHTFSNSLYKHQKESKVSYKLVAIYSNKLFPEIMPEDLPQKLI